MGAEFETFLRVLDQYITARFAELDARPRYARPPSTYADEARRQAAAMKAGDLEVVFGNCLVAALKQRHNRPGELREMLLNATAEPPAQTKPEPAEPAPVIDGPSPERPDRQAGGWNVEVVSVPPGALKDF